MLNIKFIITIFKIVLKVQLSSLWSIKNFKQNKLPVYGVISLHNPTCHNFFAVFEYGNMKNVLDVVANEANEAAEIHAWLYSRLTDDGGPASNLQR